MYHRLNRNPLIKLMLVRKISSFGILFSCIPYFDRMSSICHKLSSILCVQCANWFGEPKYEHSPFEKYFQKRCFVFAVHGPRGCPPYFQISSSININKNTFKVGLYFKFFWIGCHLRWPCLWGTVWSCRDCPDCVEKLQHAADRDTTKYNRHYKPWVNPSTGLNNLIKRKIFHTCIQDVSYCIKSKSSYLHKDVSSNMITNKLWTFNQQATWFKLALTWFKLCFLNVSLTKA